MTAAEWWTFWHTIFAPTVGTVTICVIVGLAALRAFQFLWLLLWGVREQQTKRRITPVESFDFLSGHDWTVEK